MNVKKMTAINSKILNVSVWKIFPRSCRIDSKIHVYSDKVVRMLITHEKVDKVVRMLIILPKKVIEGFNFC